MSPLRAAALAFVVVSATTGPALAQNQASPPGLYSLGVGLPLGEGWGLRSDYSPGYLSDSTYGLDGSARWSGRSRSSLYADWFPFSSSGFRVVGGFTLNDTTSSPLRASISGVTSPDRLQATGATSALGLGMGNRNAMTSTYLGVGFSQLGTTDRGLGLYADMGVTFGSLAADTDAASGGMPTLSSEGWRVQNNGWFGFTYLPSVSLGLIYRY